MRTAPIKRLAESRLGKNTNDLYEKEQAICQPTVQEI